MDIDTRSELEQVAAKLDQILRELRIHNAREEKREQELLAAQLASRTRFIGL